MKLIQFNGKQWWVFRRYTDYYVHEKVQQGTTVFALPDMRGYRVKHLRELRHYVG